MLILWFCTCNTKLKTSDSEILNNLLIKIPLISNLSKCLTTLCYHPHCNCKVCRYIFGTGTINCFMKDCWNWHTVLAYYVCIKYIFKLNNQFKIKCYECVIQIKSWDLRMCYTMKYNTIRKIVCKVK